MTASPQARILRRAAGEIGYSRWTDPKRGTKYARETQPALWPRDTWLLANGISYCDIFVTWCFWKEGLLDILPAGASYNTDYRASKGGRVPKPPRPGDVLVFDWNWRTASTNHVGICERVLPSGNYQTIEGNTSPGSAGSQGNGGGVHRRVRRPSQVRYVIRPRWGRSSTSAAAAKVSGPRFADVDETQRRLKALGYNSGPVDGKYGPRTAAATKAAQQDFGITPVDGKPGPATRKELKGIMAKIDDIARDIRTIKRSIEPGVKGKRTDGELVSALRRFRNDLPDMILDAPVALEGKWKGQQSTLRRMRAWYAEDLRQIKAGIATSRAAVLEAVQETGRAQGLTDEQVQAIATAAAEASARVSAEDVAEQLDITVKG
ncbi:peptidoglycan-binding protein [Brachybacterium sp. UMB0905]|uniref:peptidoglycan-binding protein n=1 Tax=Brachybacterium sp. UMB0905 TaxID=2069310 RepID=UPI000C81019E|nr:peptidoglycan-binding protein [Brachybacterium sp. UMB0905]PMC76762.1 hypothetical protein CJ197_00010 [Brachybacterium sp. UMB0905]